MSTSNDAVWAALALGAVSSVGLLVGMIAGAFSGNAASTYRDGHVSRGGTGARWCIPQSDRGCDPARRTNASGDVSAAAWRSGVQREQRASRAVRRRSPQAMRRIALSSTAGMRAAGRSYPYIFLLWIAI